MLSNSRAAGATHARGALFPAAWDKWTVVTRDGKWSAHFEHTVMVDEGGPRILTLLPAAVRG